MNKKTLNEQAGRRLFTNLITDPDRMPFSFDYDGKKHAGLAGLAPRKITMGGGGFTNVIFDARVDENLSIRVDAKLVHEFGQCEYTVYFENTGKKPTGVISNVRCLDAVFEGKDPVLRGNMGDHDNWYADYVHDLSNGDKYFRSDGGRATHIVFPYFDLVHGNGGTMIALGWAGTWEAMFSAAGNSTRITAGTNNGLNTVLLPGEKIRTGLVVLLPYKGRNRDDASNLWRAWFMKYNLPKADAAGNPLKPLSTVGFANDTGLPNSDGSISERYFTWKPTLEKIIQEELVADFRWFDAGWYFDPSGKTVETDWWGTVGSWELDREKWPGNTFAESNEACHKAGMKVLCWFEPERVTHVPDLVKNYGYKEDWSIGTGPVRTNNLGDPDCLEWTLGRVTKMMLEHKVDMYREDNNSDPGFAWPYRDNLETQELGLPRTGITENKCICGHYALWDGIIDFCRQNGKCTFVDSCASGGGRNDIESMRRGFPLMRSDYDRTSSSMRLSQTSTLCRWLPFHGSCTREASRQLEVSKGAGPNVYVARASFLPIYNFGEAFSHSKELDFDLFRRNFNEWKSVRHLLTKDMYVLTPWRHDLDRSHWTAFAYDDPDAGESLLLAFRMEDAEEPCFMARLPFADPAATYEAVNGDTGEKSLFKGKNLREEGLPVTLGEPKSSALFRIKKTG
jgi:alpha-galactosidase